MKWLIIQSDGEHKGQDSWSPNWFLRECYGIRDALVANNQQADIWGLRHANYATVPDFESYDAILVLENYETGWLPDLNRITKPLLLQWIIDLHWQPWEAYTGLSEHMDVVLHSTPSLIEPYQRRVPNPKHLWFPNAIDDKYFTLDGYVPRLPGHVRSLDIVFIGGKGKPREEAIDRMVAEAGMFYGYGITGLPYVDHLRRAKIGFNKNLAEDINYRTFEVLGCGACLLTQRNPYLEQLGFIDGQNCVLYESDDTAIRTAKGLISTGRWIEIGQVGYALSKRHTYTERVKHFLLPHL